MAGSQQLSSKHRTFVPIIAALEDAEGSIGTAGVRAIRLETGEIGESLAHGLLPHAVGEGRTVFPVLRRMPSGATTTRELTEQHREIARLTDELERLHGRLSETGTLGPDEERLRSVLHTLRTTVREHLETEDEICYSVLQAELTPEEAQRLCDEMEEAAATVRRHYE
jgi:iron-sulfur cluster repair protein YtfE (RIC family)